MIELLADLAAAIDLAIRTGIAFALLALAAVGVGALLARRVR